jgi:hypothetical protein
METKLKNLISSSDEKGVSIYPENAKTIFLPYFRKEVDFSSDRDGNDIIKSCEAIIRIDEAYDSFKAHVINNIPGMNKCALYSNINSDIAKLEMHHGPIFTLFDYVEITIIYLLKHEKKLSTFAIADRVLEDHKDCLIQVIMLCEMAHYAVHPRKLGIKGEFISIDSAFGDLVSYLNKYKDCIGFRHLMKIKKYLNEYKEKNLLDSKNYTILKESIKSFKNPLFNSEGG